MVAIEQANLELQAVNVGAGVDVDRLLAHVRTLINSAHSESICLDDVTALSDTLDNFGQSVIQGLCQVVDRLQDARTDIEVLEAWLAAETERSAAERYCVEERVGQLSSSLNAVRLRLDSWMERSAGIENEIRREIVESHQGIRAEVNEIQTGHRALVDQYAEVPRMRVRVSDLATLVDSILEGLTAVQDRVQSDTQQLRSDVETRFVVLERRIDALVLAGTQEPEFGRSTPAQKTNRRSKPKKSAQSKGKA